MDKKVGIKEEPVSLEGTASTSFLFADVKDEMFIDEQTVGPLVPCFKEEDTAENIAVFTRSLVDSCSRCRRELNTGGELMCDLPTNKERLNCCNECNQHLFSLSGERLLNNKECNTTVSVKANLESHMSRSREGTQCSKKHVKNYSRKRKSERNMVYHSVGLFYGCNLCGKSFCGKFLSNHLPSHSAPRVFYCNECNTKFSEKHHLKVHMLSHTRERNYRCNECGTLFFQRVLLKAHTNTHTKDREFLCEECGKMFSKKYQLLAHLKTHTGERLYNCGECTKAFSSSSHLNDHVLTHSERSLRCNECGRMFSQKRILKDHMLTHTNVRSHSCIECGRLFSRKTDMNRHLRTHTGERPHSCNICSRQFSRKADLKIHMRTHPEFRMALQV